MHAFGPVPSRRLGRSLGVSPIPAKVCPYSCVYCQLGRTNRLQVERESFFPREEILADVERVVSSSEKADIITFVGDGEPTLSADLGWLIGQCKARWPLPVAVITNGALLWRPDVREDLAQADIVMPSLDAASATLWGRVNRPHPAISCEEMVQGLEQLCREVQGEIRVEVMLVKNLNDSDEALGEIAAALERIRPHRVTVNVPVRPPAEPWVQIPDPRRLLRVMELLGDVDLIQDPEAGAPAGDSFDSAARAILETCARHPLLEAQARALEARFEEQQVVERLEQEGRLIIVEHNGARYVMPSWFERGEET
jgi:wyosine [tRNA(Phe)-imidazoG37] synthetase (radical SAM superfamily)